MQNVRRSSDMLQEASSLRAAGLDLFKHVFGMVDDGAAKLGPKRRRKLRCGVSVLRRPAEFRSDF